MTSFPVLVERSTNRCSRAMFRDGAIVIRLARGLPSGLAQEHVASLTRRMRRLAERERMRVPLDPFRPLFHGTTSVAIPLCDGTVLHIRRTAGTRFRLRKTGLLWECVLPPGGDVRSAHRALWRALAAHMAPHVAAAVATINATCFGFAVRSVRLRHTTTQWGSCGSQGNICLNTALATLPAPLMAYVAIHELAHLRYRNHGRRFWHLVERACPAFHERIAALRTYRIVTP